MTGGGVGASRLPPSALPGISPSRGEIDLRRGSRPSLTLRFWKGCALPISPLEGEMSGRTEGG
ncbi:propionyl-coenzyme A carboxylase alpha polypeptide [bacterium M00.F.Ca.ET.194.01.1.1]|nr:MAG: propionyl-coenzyme A carboxylase alpha polypeptide [Rhizobium sp.]TGR69779.1 propionyl-coenzyme A carboxylase alpha polypeptide [bacterium M00.F.Ca.ET.194.01.1.1]TGS55319.1 propionyl-coenzyme A carboxylase alpha polypeptide [bacterium M00.F.Ca.ET.179.01.1.1]TGV48197.1 propionyl-coenzyme A carboxylase alpha polypeptide [bacterium M00.F.Ca.ET.168.01.1.1]